MGLGRPILPPDAITCARGAEIPIYRLEDGRVVETKENGVTCKNPALIDLMPSEQACTCPRAMSDLIGQSLAHFRIVEKLGEGGMGIVYRATDEKLRRAVALKVLPESFAKNDDRRRRFLREARSAAAVTHANIATVYEADEADGHVYIAMELVDGETLRSVLETPASVAEALRIAKDVARGLARAHERGIVHRDLKPENVMISGHGEVKILDFGLAKLSDDAGASPSALEHDETSTHLTRAGSLLGTPAYMSPEQARGLDVDARTDVFSFGVVLYEMMTGERPFTGETTQDVLTAVMRDTPRRASERNPLLPADVDRVIERCLEKLRDGRYANGQELLDALGALSPESPISKASNARELISPTVSLLTPASPNAVALQGGARRRRGLFALAIGSMAAVGGAAAWMRHAPAADGRTKGPSGSASVSVTETPTLSPADGYSDRKLATVANRAARIAALSPDGKQVVFDDGDAVWIRPFAGGVPRRLSFPNRAPGDVATTISFFPDGSRALVSMGRGSRVTTYVASVDGSPAHAVDGLDADAMLAPDGEHVALKLGKTVDVLTLAGGARQTVAVCGVICEEVAWSPDSQRLVVYDKPASLRVVRADGSGSETLFSDRSLYQRGGQAMAWPSTNRVLFTGHTTDNHTVLREISVDAAGRATSSPHDVWRGHDSPLTNLSVAGSRMAITFRQSNGEVYVAGLTGDAGLAEEPKRFTFNDGHSRQPAWLPDGRIVYWSLRESQPALYVQALGASEPTLYVGAPVAPDVAAVVLGTGELLYLRSLDDADAGARARFGLGGLGDAHGAFDLPIAERQSIRCGGGDTSRCVIGAFQNGELTLARLDLVTGLPGVPFFRLRKTRWAGDIAVSPDGKTVALTTEDEFVTLIPISGGEPTSLTTLPRGTDLRAVSFAPDGRSLVIAGAGVDGAADGIIHVGLDGRGVLLARLNDYVEAASISPDGRKLLWGQWALSFGVLLLEPGR
jgi:serine/threonine protein kinase